MTTDTGKKREKKIQNQNSFQLVSPMQPVKIKLMASV